MGRKHYYWKMLTINPYLKNIHVYTKIDGVMVSVLAASVVDRGFESQSDQAKDHKIVSLISKGNDLLAWNPDNVSEWSDLLAWNPDNVSEWRDLLAWNPDNVSEWRDCLFSELAL